MNKIYNSGIVVKAITKDDKVIPVQDVRSVKPHLLVGGDGDLDIGGVVQPIDVFVYKRKKNENRLEYFAPNLIAISLSTAFEALSKAKNIYDELIDFEKYEHGGYSDIESVKIKTGFIYDYIQEIQKASVFGYTAIETFYNLSIPDGYSYELKKNKRGIVEIYDKLAIERWLTLKDKVALILKDIYSTKNPKSQKWWNNFCELETIRHNIIHPKTISSHELYKNYFDKNIFDKLKVPVEVIEFFEKSMIDNNQLHDFLPWTDLGMKYNKLKVMKSGNVEITGNIHNCSFEK